MRWVLVLPMCPSCSPIKRRGQFPCSWCKDDCVYLQVGSEHLDSTIRSHEKWEGQRGSLESKAVPVFVSCKA